MALRGTYQTEAEVPEALRDLYVEDDEGAWHIDADVENHPNCAALGRAVGHATRERDEAQSRARAAQKLVEKAQAKVGLEKYDVGDYEKAVKVLDGVEKASAAKTAAYGEILKMKDVKISELEAANKDVASELVTAKIIDAVEMAAIDRGASGQTMADILRRAHKDLTIEDGAVVAPDGQTPADWLDALKKSGKHLFPRTLNQGTGISAPPLHGSRAALGSLRPNNHGGVHPLIASGEFSHCK